MAHFHHFDYFLHHKSLKVKIINAFKWQIASKQAETRNGWEIFTIYRDTAAMLATKLLWVRLVAVLFAFGRPDNGVIWRMHTI